MDNTFSYGFVIDTSGQNENETANKSFEIPPSCEGSVVSRVRKRRNYVCSFLEENVIAKLLSEYETSLKSPSKDVPDRANKEAKKQTVNTWNHGDKGKNLKSATKVDIQAILKKSVITPDFEKLHSIPAYEESEKKLREMRKVTNFIITQVGLFLPYMHKCLL